MLNHVVDMVGLQHTGGGEEEAKHQSISNYLHGLDAGGTPSGTWRQRNGSID